MKKLICIILVFSILYPSLVYSQAAELNYPLLCIDVNETEDVDYDTAFQIALDAGMEATSLSFQWDMIETSPYTYEDPYGFLEIANIYYPAYDIPINLMIGPIDTVANRMPDDLQDKPFNDPEIIQRYYQMVLFVLDMIQDVSLVSFSIGNEIDIYLNSDDQWDAYIDFFNQTKQLIKPHIPDVPIGSKATLYGHLDSDTEKLNMLNQQCDAVFVTYYPLKGNYDVKAPSVVFEDFDAITTQYPGRDLFFHEAGYPSSSEINSSEEKQSQFIQFLFDAWNEHTDQIKMVNIVWLYDISQGTLAEFEQYYGSSNPGFLAYLATLGIRHHEDAAKKAYITLKNITNPEPRPLPPSTPKGPHEGIKGVSYTFTSTSTDPSGEDLYYKWDFGNGIFSDWDGPYPTGEQMEITHTWQQTGDFQVRAQARNVQGVESDWSDSLPISMPKTKLVFLLDLLLDLNPTLYHIILLFLS